jgi:hypothetical protein
MESIETARDFPPSDARSCLEEAVSHPLETRIVILPWADPVVEAVGHDPRSPYVEQFYLALLGPTLTFLLRRLADGLDAWPDGFEADTADLAEALGLATVPGGRHGPFARALTRAVRFGLATPRAGGLAVRRMLPPLTQRQIARLPALLRDAHEQWSPAEAA